MQSKPFKAIERYYLHWEHRTKWEKKDNYEQEANHGGVGHTKDMIIKQSEVDKIEEAIVYQKCGFLFLTTTTICNHSSPKVKWTWKLDIMGKLFQMNISVMYI